MDCYKAWFDTFQQLTKVWKQMNNVVVSPTQGWAGEGSVGIFNVAVAQVDGSLPASVARDKLLKRGHHTVKLAWVEVPENKHCSIGVRILKARDWPRNQVGRSVYIGWRWNIHTAHNNLRELTGQVEESNWNGQEFNMRGTHFLVYFEIRAPTIVNVHMYMHPPPPFSDFSVLSDHIKLNPSIATSESGIESFSHILQNHITEASINTWSCLQFKWSSSALLSTRASSHCASQSSGAVWKSKWPSCASHPNEPCGFCGRKATLNHTHTLVTVCP